MSLSAILVGIAVFAMSGCSSAPAEVNSPTGSNHTVVSGLPPVSSLADSPPGETARFRTGEEVDLAVPVQNSMLVPHGIYLMPQWLAPDGGDFAGLAFAGYTFAVSGLSGPEQIAFHWSVQPPSGSVWIALANWERNHWDLVGLSSNSELQLVSIDPYIKFPGRLSLAVIAAGNTQSELGWIRVGPNLAPSASLDGSPPVAIVGNPYTLHGGSSLDLDGWIANYEWDLDADGVYEVSTGTINQLQTTFESAGQRNVSLRVTDNSGADAAAARQITVTDGMYDAADFEAGWQGWEPDVADVIVSGDDEIYWEIVRSLDIAASGQFSVWMTAENRTDACKLWIEKHYVLEPETTYQATISYKFASNAAGEVGTWTILAGALAEDPETGPQIRDAGLARESTYNGGVPSFTWLDKSYSMEVTTGPAGDLFVMVGVWGVFEVLQEYYIDDVTVQIAPM
jgi:hypothetical protein